MPSPGKSASFAVDSMPDPPPKRPRLKRAQSSVLIAQQRAGLIASIEKAATGETSSAEAVRAMFHEHDKDGNGVLDYDELRGLLHAFGEGTQRLHPNYIEHYLRVADRHHKKHVTLDDFSLVYERLQRFDQLLQAPKRRLLQPMEKPAALSKLKGVASLVCPPVETVTLEEEEEVQEAAAAGEAEAASSSSEPAPPRRLFRVDAHFQSLELIGEGGYGMICSAVDGRSGDAPVAIKRVAPTEDRLQLRCCLRELAILQHFGAHSHPNLLGLREVLRPPSGHLAEWRDLYLVTERLDMDLQHVLKSDQPLDETHMRFFIWQLLRGVHAVSLIASDCF